jgi:ABC-type branched-subunit amino acid transport system ATPase component/ABC-type branched-subunit amino acid transport system permease subunit
VAASADNRPLARLCGVNPKRVSTFVWVAAALLSTLAIMLLAGRNGIVSGVDNLGPLTLGRALVAATIARMRSFARALAAGAAIGVIESLLRFNFFDQPGLIDFVMFLAVVVAVFFQRRGHDDQVFAFAPKVRMLPDEVRSVWWVRQLPLACGGLMLAAAVALPFIVELPSRHLLYATVICFAICASSATVVTGWAGQLSLSQMTFAGFGALTAAALVRGMRIDMLGIDVTLPALPFLLSIVVSSVVVAALAALVGLGALRVRGLLLGVVTFGLALAAQEYLYERSVFSNGEPSSVAFPRGSLFGIDLGSQRRYYFVCLAALAVVVAVLARLRRTGTGRRIVGVRDNPDSAAGYTVDPARTRLTAFALGGGIAALGGGLLAGVIENVPFSERFFLVNDSLRLVAMVVIGGVGSVFGAVFGALWVIGLPAFFPNNQVVPLFTSSVGLLIIVMYFPGGFAQIAEAARGALINWAERRVTTPSTTAVDAAPAQVRPVPAQRRAPVTAEPQLAVLRANSLSVAFGGKQALREVSVAVDAHEIIGLIGPNGAGKSTLMNAVGGFVPSSGVVHLGGVEISSLSASSRAANGLGRTFQAARLFPELTVRETVQLALEARHRSSLLQTSLLMPGSYTCERRQRSEADELIDFVGLGRYARRYISELSTGTRRIVELAGLLAVDARLLCLDEPTAGIAQREAEAFGPLLVQIRRELGASMMVVEHDMPLIMSISDRVYCLESGRMIAHGTPSEVRNDPKVIASYLGTDERALQRSNASA